MNNIYDVLIVGGGIAGLYLNYKLLKSKKSKKTLLVEKYGVIGGRIQTKNIKFKNKKYSMEAGAGRFNSNHKILIKLIKKFNLQKKMIPLNSTYKVLTIKKKWNNNEISGFLPYQILDYLFQDIKLTPKMKKIDFSTWLKQNVTKEIYDYLYDTYPYGDIFKINAYDAIKLYLIDLNINNKFYVLAGGLSQIPLRLEKEIKKLKGKIKTETTFKSYKKIDGLYKIKINDEFVFAKKIVFTIQRPDLLKIRQLTPLKNLINGVHNAPLIRVYAIFPIDTCAWFKNIPKILTDSPLSYFIPINDKIGLTMLSYCDEHRAKYLHRIEQQKGKQALGKFLVNECKKIFKTNDIPQALWIGTYYWEHGVGDWKPGYDSKKISQQIKKPFKTENIFICGENYSENFQCWMEGGLQTAEDIYKII
tara:strand:- start:129 stop:1382 length:1254 start_codon:yes stop_codon:yes gene_type:complete